MSTRKYISNQRKASGKAKVYKYKIDVAFGEERNKQSRSGSVYTIRWAALRDRIKELGGEQPVALTATEFGIDVWLPELHQAARSGPLTEPLK